MAKKYICGDRSFSLNTGRHFKVGKPVPASIVDDHDLEKQGLVKVDESKSKNGGENQNGAET